VYPHLGHFTEEKKRPQTGQTVASRPTSEPQFSQKYRGFFTPLPLQRRGKAPHALSLALEGFSVDTEEELALRESFI
jgi:hypothetical protein